MSLPLLWPLLFSFPPWPSASLSRHPRVIEDSRTSSGGLCGLRRQQSWPCTRSCRSWPCRRSWSRLRLLKYPPMPRTRAGRWTLSARAIGGRWRNDLKGKHFKTTWELVWYSRNSINISGHKRVLKHCEFIIRFQSTGINSLSAM